MIDLDKIFNKNSPKLSNQDAFDFLDHNQNDGEKWFDDDQQNLSDVAIGSAINYVEEFGLEKSSNNFHIIPELKEAIADYFERCQIECVTSNVFVRVGIFELLHDLYKIAGIKNGEKVLFTLPISGYFIQQCYDNEIAVEFLNTDPQNNWQIDFSALENILEKHSIKILFLGNPNPINGTALSKDDMLNLAKILHNHKDLLVITDESLREFFISKNNQINSLAAIDDISSQIITISNLKCYGLGGLSIAFACIKNKNIIDNLPCDKINISKANQYIAIAALKISEDSQKHLSQIKEQISQNYSLVLEELKIINENLGQKFDKKDNFIKSINGESQINNSVLLQFSSLKGSKGSGDESDSLETDLDMAKFLKKEAGILMMPGQCCFLPAKKMILRFYLLKSQQELQAGFKRINQALMKLKTLGHNISVINSSKLNSSQNDKGK